MPAAVLEAPFTTPHPLPHQRLLHGYTAVPAPQELKAPPALRVPGPSGCSQPCPCRGGGGAEPAAFPPCPSPRQRTSCGRTLLLVAAVEPQSWGLLPRLSCAPAARRDARPRHDARGEPLPTARALRAAGLGSAPPAGLRHCCALRSPWPGCHVAKVPKQLRSETAPVARRRWQSGYGQVQSGSCTAALALLKGGASKCGF